MKNVKFWNKNIHRIIICTGLILLIPLIAMQFTDEVKWGVEDFLAISILLIGSGVIYELISRQLKNRTHRIILGIAWVIGIILIWVELAVGIFD